MHECLCVCMYVRHMHVIPKGARRGRQIPQNFILRGDASCRHHGPLSPRLSNWPHLLWGLPYAAEGRFLHLHGYLWLFLEHYSVRSLWLPAQDFWCSCLAQGLLFALTSPVPTPTPCHHSPPSMPLDFSILPCLWSESFSEDGTWIRYHLGTYQLLLLATSDIAS